MCGDYVALACFVGKYMYLPASFLILSSQFILMLSAWNLATCNLYNACHWMLIVEILIISICHSMDLSPAPCSVSSGSFLLHFSILGIYFMNVSCFHFCCISLLWIFNVPFNCSFLLYSRNDGTDEVDETTLVSVPPLDLDFSATDELTMRSALTPKPSSSKSKSSKKVHYDEESLRSTGRSKSAPPDMDNKGRSKSVSPKRNDSKDNRSRKNWNPWKLLLQCWGDLLFITGALCYLTLCWKSDHLEGSQDSVNWMYDLDWMHQFAECIGDGYAFTIRGTLHFNCMWKWVACVKYKPSIHLNHHSWFVFIELYWFFVFVPFSVPIHSFICPYLCAPFCHVYSFFLTESPQ